MSKAKSRDFFKWHSAYPPERASKNEAIPYLFNSRGVDWTTLDNNTTRDISRLVRDKRKYCQVGWLVTIQRNGFVDCLDSVITSKFCCLANMHGIIIASVLSRRTLLQVTVAITYFASSSTIFTVYLSLYTIRHNDAQRLAEGDQWQALMGDGRAQCITVPSGL